MQSASFWFPSSLGDFIQKALPSKRPSEAAFFADKSGRLGVQSIDREWQGTASSVGSWPVCAVHIPCILQPNKPPAARKTWPCGTYSQRYCAWWLSMHGKVTARVHDRAPSLLPAALARVHLFCEPQQIRDTAIPLRLVASGSTRSGWHGL